MPSARDSIAGDAPQTPTLRGSINKSGSRQTPHSSRRTPRSQARTPGTAGSAAAGSGSARGSRHRDAEYWISIIEGRAGSKEIGIAAFNSRRPEIILSQFGDSKA